MSEKIDIKPRRSRNFYESEAYKKLRTNIQFSGKSMKVIAFTSNGPNEGKTEVSFRLAWSLAEIGKKTVFVDVDLRNSSLLKKYKINCELRGLAHYLVGENSLDEIIAHTQNPYFDIIPIGAFPPNPSELLSQDVYKELLAELKEKYDYVILDTPPAGLVVDGVIASSAADGVIMLLSSGDVTFKQTKATLDELSKANCKVIGCVLNKCGQKKGSAYGYGYYGKYGGYSKYGNYGKYGSYGGYGGTFSENAPAKRKFFKLRRKFKSNGKKVSK